MMADYNAFLAGINPNCDRLVRQKGKRARFGPRG